MAAPIFKVSPSLPIILKIPSASAGNSNVALSDSSSHITSSILTKSPSFFTQAAIVTSVTDSPTEGTFMSIAIINSIGMLYLKFYFEYRCGSLYNQLLVKH